VVLERDGLPGFTHRAVAAEAGVALASATYHFEGIDDLAVSVILKATDEFTQAIRARTDGASVAGYASALAAELSSHRGRVVAGYELCLLAARRPALREAAAAWMRAGTEALLGEVDPLRQQAFVAVVNAVCLEAMLADSRPDASEVQGLLEHVLR